MEKITSLKMAVGGFLGPDYSMTVDLEIGKALYRERVYQPLNGKWGQLPTT
jgi:hypothetical protein